MHLEQENQIVEFAVRQVLADPHLSTPAYCEQMPSNGEAENPAAALPLICIWNEDARGAFMLSVNRPVLAHLLSALVPRNDPSFKRIHDDVMLEIMHASTRHVAKACRASGKRPSEEFFPGVNRHAI